MELLNRGVLLTDGNILHRFDIAFSIETRLL